VTEAHLTIVFTALAVSRTVQDRTGWTIRKILRELRPLRSATIDPRRDPALPPALNDDHRALIDAIRAASPRQ
jgi:DNA-binding GntR family transcriptional regulator